MISDIFLQKRLFAFKNLQTNLINFFASIFPLILEGALSFPQKPPAPRGPFVFYPLFSIHKRKTFLK